MTKKNAEKLAGEIIPLLRHMFGEGINFDCTEYFQSNETLIGIALKLPGCTSVPVVCLSDMPDDISATDAANIAATIFQKGLRNFKDFPILPEMSREDVLKNVVLQVLSRRRNRQMLKTHPHIPFLDLAGVFRVPVGEYKKNSLNTMLISNQIAEKLELSVDVPSSIHELMIARDDGLVEAKALKEIIYEGNRNDSIIKQEDVLSDSIYFYSCEDKTLKIA